MSEETLDLKRVKLALRSFADKRDWGKFHNPKNLVMALSVESSELVEIFQWLNEGESKTITDSNEKMEQVKDEIADILMYTIRLADVLNFDISESIKSKMEKNEIKYPVEMAKGNAKKYTEL
jgi:dCTP diphosphatase